MSGLDIETSVRANAPITTVVLNNGGMATYPGGYPTARERFGLTEMTGDYAKIAEGLGAVGITVTEPSDVDPFSYESSTAKRGRGHGVAGHSYQYGRSKVALPLNNSRPLSQAQYWLKH